MAIRDVVSVLADLPTLLAPKKGLKPRPVETKGKIIPLLEELFGKAGREVAQLDGVAFTAGPGTQG